MSRGRLSSCSLGGHCQMGCRKVLNMRDAVVKHAECAARQDERHLHLTKKRGSTSRTRAAQHRCEGYSRSCDRRVEFSLVPHARTFVFGM
eukprot:1652922-Pleurochrysis_carterae.AAC.1